MSLGKEFQAAGVREESARAPAAITLEWLQTQCDQLERVLRMQPDWDELAAPHFLQLETLKPDTTTRAMQRWSLLKHMYMVRSEGLRRASEEDPEVAQRSAFELLRREPVSLRLENGRTVRVTSRSFAAMIELAAHHSRIRLLQVQLDHVAEVYGRALDAHRVARGWIRRKELRRRAEKLQSIYRRLYVELHGHRERLYANAMTPSGASAAMGEEPPAWWTETTLADDARLLVALYEVGPHRYHKLGPAPEPSGKKRSTPAEDWGYEGLLTAWGIRRKVEPARMLDQDLAQVLTEMRLAAPPTLEEEMEA